MSDQLVKYGEELLEKYNENSALRVVASLIIGPLDTFLSSEGQKIVQRRMISLLNCLKIEMKSIREETINKDYLESEEFYDLVFMAFEAASRTRNNNKIQWYAKILKNSFIKEKDVFLPEDYMNILKELTEDEIQVASELFRRQGKKKLEDFENQMAFAKGCGWDTFQDYLNVTHPRKYLFILSRLEKSGLIKEITGTYQDYDGGIYFITDTFRDLMEFLE